MDNNSGTVSGLESFEPVVWTSAYELGVEDIDIQHRFFVNLINRLARELARAEDAQLAALLIAELNAYARFHFLSEENMMLRAGYPDLEQHRRHHYQLIERLSVRESRLALDESGGGLELVRFLIEWFFNHTNVEDRQFSEFLLGRREARD